MSFMCTSTASIGVVPFFRLRFGEVRLGLLQPEALEGSFEQHDMIAMMRLMVSYPSASKCGFDLQFLLGEVCPARGKQAVARKNA